MTPEFVVFRKNENNTEERVDLGSEARPHAHESCTKPLFQSLNEYNGRGKPVMECRYHWKGQLRQRLYLDRTPSRF